MANKKKFFFFFLLKNFCLLGMEVFSSCSVNKILSFSSSWRWFPNTSAAFINFEMHTKHAWKLKYFIFCTSLEVHLLHTLSMALNICWLHSLQQGEILKIKGATLTRVPTRYVYLFLFLYKADACLYFFLFSLKHKVNTCLDFWILMQTRCMFSFFVDLFFINFIL